MSNKLLLDFFVARLEEAGEARHVVLAAPLGLGAASLLQFEIERSTAKGSVLITVPSLALMRQWIARLGDVGIPAMEISKESALQEMELNARSHFKGVFVTLLSRLNHGPTRSYVRSLQPEILIVDDFTFAAGGRLEIAVSEISRNSRRTLMVARGYGSILSLPEWLMDSTFIGLPQGTPDQQRAKAQVHLYDHLESENSLLAQAKALLREVQGPNSLSDSGTLYVPQGRAALYASVLDITGVEKLTNEQSERAWLLLEELEELPPDPRLAKLKLLVDKLTHDGPVWVVCGHRVADSYYLAESLAKSSDHSVGVLNSQTYEPQGVLEQCLIEGHITVLTSTFLRSMPFSNRVSLVYASLPQDYSEFEGLLATQAVKVVVVIAPAHQDSTTSLMSFLSDEDLLEPTGTT